MKKTLFLAAIAVTALASCKKENTGSPVQPVNLDYKPKTITSNSGTTSYKYDALGRRIQAIYTNGTRRDYEYQNGIVNEKAYDNAGVLTVIYKQELNSEGLAVKETISNDPGYTRTRQYNSDKQMLQWMQVKNGTTLVADFFYSDGNCDSVRFKQNGNWTYTERNTYYTDKPNVLGSDNLGTSHYGKHSKNLSKTTQNVFSNGSANGIETASYEFDSKGRITKGIYLLNGNTANILYTY